MPYTLTVYIMLFFCYLLQDDFIFVTLTKIFVWQDNRVKNYDLSWYCYISTWKRSHNNWNITFIVLGKQKM